MLWSPAKVAIAGMFVWLFLRVVAPVRVIEPLEVTAILFLILCYGFFIVGCRLADHGKKIKINPSNAG